MRVLRVLRWVGYGVAGLVLVLFVTVQGQQRLLRRRAERLHAEIVALQMHPGTFSDVHRMQREWGRFGHWDGECTKRHCIYEILLTDWWMGYKLRHAYDEPRFGRVYTLLGGREARVFADIQVREDRMWGENFSVGATAVDWTHLHSYDGRFYPSESMLFVSTNGGSRLFGPDEALQGVSLAQSYRVGFRGSCSGCVGGEIFMTPDTNPADMAWLTDIDFSCLTRRRQCETEDELIPRAWPHRDWDQPENLSLQNVLAVRVGREADDAAIIEITRRRSAGPEDHREQGADVRVVEVLKNGQRHPKGSSMFLWVESALIIEGGGKNAHVEIGQRYILAYYDDRSPLSGLEVRAIMAATPENLAAFRIGVAADPSTGEPYNWRRYPPYNHNWGNW